MRPCGKPFQVPKLEVPSLKRISGLPLLFTNGVKTGALRPKAAIKLFTVVGLNVCVSLRVPVQDRLKLLAPFWTRFESMKVLPVLLAWLADSPTRPKKVSFFVTIQSMRLE